MHGSGTCATKYCFIQNALTVILRKVASIFLNKKQKQIWLPSKHVLLFRCIFSTVLIPTLNV